MSLRVTGRIVSSDINCVKCGTGIRVSGKPEDLFCNACGCYYKLMKAEIIENQVELEYDSMGFVCMFSTYNSNCRNYVPSPDTYCKDHSDDKTIEKVKQEIEYTEKNLNGLKVKLERIEESKKIWLINKLSGLDNDASKQ